MIGFKSILSFLFIVFNSYAVPSIAADAKQFTDLLTCAMQLEQINQKPVVQISYRKNVETDLYISAGWPGLPEPASYKKNLQNKSPGITFFPKERYGNYANLAIDFRHQQRLVVNGVEARILNGLLQHCEGDVFGGDGDHQCMLGSYTDKVVCAVYGDSKDLIPGN